MADASGRAMCLSLLAAMPRAVLAAPPVQRALAIWAALETNNWARFFSLARQASYVEACFLHRHFRGVRSRALRTMAGSLKDALGGEDAQVGGGARGGWAALRAGITGAAAHLLPPHLPTRQAVLCTVDTATAREYCEHHGLSIVAPPPASAAAAPGGCGWAVAFGEGFRRWAPGEGALRRQLEPQLVRMQAADEEAIAAAAARGRGRRAALVDVRLWAAGQPLPSPLVSGLLPRGVAAFPPQVRRASLVTGAVAAPLLPSPSAALCLRRQPRAEGRRARCRRHGPQARDARHCGARGCGCRGGSGGSN